MRRDNQLRDDASVIVLGDSLIDFALKLNVATLTEYLVVILSVPQHTYVFPEDMAWCFAYTGMATTALACQLAALLAT
jgi:hypothetical protein